MAQAEYIKQHFMEKAQPQEKLITEVGSNSQDSCLAPKVRRQDSKHEWGFISGFHEQNWEIEVIIKKHWNILCMDKVLSKVLPENPPFIYRKTSSFGIKWSRKYSILQAKPKCFGIEQVFYACRKCKACQQVATHLRGLTSFVSTANGKGFQIKEFISCSSTHVVYALECHYDIRTLQ